MAEIVCPHCHATMPRDDMFCPTCGSFVGPGDPDQVHEHVETVRRNARTASARSAASAGATAPAASAPRPRTGHDGSGGDFFDEALATVATEPATPRPGRPAAAAGRTPTDLPGDEPPAGDPLGSATAPDEPSHRGRPAFLDDELDAGGPRRRPGAGPRRVRTRPDDDVDDDPYPSDRLPDWRRGRDEDAGEPRERTRTGRDRRGTGRADRPDRTGGSDRTDRADRVAPAARLVAAVVGLPARLRETGRRLGVLPVAVGAIVAVLLVSSGVLYAAGAFDGHRAADSAPARPHPLTPAKVRASCTAGPSTDAAGHKVTFGARHLTDGDTTTAWRCDRAGAHPRIVLTFARPVTVTGLALVPGWAAKDAKSGADRFAENGAPTGVTWRLGQATTVQRTKPVRPRWYTTAPAHAVRTDRVVLRLDGVRQGGSRPTVAVSEIRVTGR